MPTDTLHSVDTAAVPGSGPAGGAPSDPGPRPPAAPDGHPATPGGHPAVAGGGGAPALVDWYRDGSVVVADLALACCAVESELAAPLDAPRLDHVPDGARVVAVVSGTLTDALAPVVRRALDLLPDPFVVAFGGCACIGGPYWDSYAVTKGVDQLVAVDAFVPGCPPPPGALDDVVRGVRAGSASARPANGASS